MTTLDSLLSRVRACRLCASQLPCEPRPILRAAPTERLLIIGQAPGIKAHESGIPWNDASGIRLRGWLGLSREQFYDERHVAIMPMGFCYPGKGKAGDLPPRPECAPTWHASILAQADLACVDPCAATEHRTDPADRPLRATRLPE